MKVGILDILTNPPEHWMQRSYDPLITKQLVGITPQVIAVWCRQLGHQVSYATYYGYGNLQRLLPDDLNLVFISCFTTASPLAYALAKLYRKKGIQTVIGGPHAKAYPADCLRFFDFVVKECDKNLIKEIIEGHCNPGTYISSYKPFDELPSVEERMPEIRASAFTYNKWPGFLMTLIPLMTSQGCPYSCDFCIDWDNPYRLMSMERLAADLAYISKNHPKCIVGFYEPNFAVKFEQVFNILEEIPKVSRVPYMMECSQSVLNPKRIERLKETFCSMISIGIENWWGYSNKSGLRGNKGGEEQLCQTIETFQHLQSDQCYLQATFIFGLDDDFGDAPIEMTKHFIEEAPFVWPVINTPTPYGGTPLHQQFLEDGRIMEEMPFVCYSTPHLVSTLKHYDPITYFEKMVDLSCFISSRKMQKRRLASTSNWKHKLINRIRTVGEKELEKIYREKLELLRSDPQFLAFHEGKMMELPEYYNNVFERTVGCYSELITKAERRPNLEQLTPLFIGNEPIKKRI